MKEKPIINLYQALRVNRESKIAFVGAGGKTSSVFLLARLCAPPVIISTTTHLGVNQVIVGDEHVVIESDLIPDAIKTRIKNEAKVWVITGGRSGRDRWGGLNDDGINQLVELADEINAPLLIEADGSRMRPVKAPADHEPVIPNFVTDVVVCAGLNAIEKPLGEMWVHRPALFGVLSGLRSGETITVQAITRVLLHLDGGLKNIPIEAKKIALINQTDTQQRQSIGREIADAIAPGYDSIVLASIKKQQIYAVKEGVGGVILAAGGSTRFGSPKQFAIWEGKPLIRHVVEKALAAGLSQVVVIVGEQEAGIRKALKGLAVGIVENPGWRAGLSTSVKVGIKVLRKQIGSVMFLLADQPQVPVPLIRSLVTRHEETLSPIIAPLIDQERGNPVLFDRKTFGAFSQIEGDQGGRALFSKFPIEWIPWHDRQALLDIDTPEDLDKLVHG